MKSMKDFFGSLFGQEQKPRQEAKPAAPVRREAPRQAAAERYKKGDFIGGKYEVHGTLGKGGFGVVYLVRDDLERHVAWAVKTFKDELLADAAAREAFKKEALLWVNLEEHPFILTARWVEAFSERLFVIMDYVAPDAQGRVSLADHVVRAGSPLDVNQALEWAIQFCLGMEHACAHGIKCHRDIKPANILITQDGTLKITDFGLAAAAEVAWRGAAGQGGSLVTGGPEGGFGFSLLQAEGKVRCGTPGYMAPEVYRCEAADVRSDIYSFGLVLWQMATGSPVPPFIVPCRDDLEDYLRGIYKQQMAGRVPQVESSLASVIEHCLNAKPSHRYANFEELRTALESIFERRTGREYEVPQTGKQGANRWIRKGASLYALARYEDAIGCYERALRIDPRSAAAWSNKGAAFGDLGRCEEAIACYDKALAIDPRLAAAWNNKGRVLQTLGRCEEAVVCLDIALAINPRDATAWYNKGNALGLLGRVEEAIGCYDKALAIDPQCANAWDVKGIVLSALGRRKEAIVCFEKVLAINPRNAAAWNNKALCEKATGRWKDTAESYRKFIEFAQPQYAAQVAQARQRLLELESKRA